jgi:hypothetical protein
MHKTSAIEQEGRWSVVATFPYGCVDSVGATSTFTLPELTEVVAGLE